MINNSLTYSITAAGLTQSLTLTDLYDEYILRTTGTVTLAGSVTITPNGTPTKDLIIIRYTGSMLLNGNTFTVFGQNIDQDDALSNLRIECKYDSTSSSWEVLVIPDTRAAQYDLVKRTTWTDAGAVVTLTPGVDEHYQEFTTSGAIVALGSYSVAINGAYTPVEGDEFIVRYSGQITLGANTLTIFGQSIPAVWAAAGGVEVRHIYDLDTTTWITSVKPILHDNIYRTMGSSTDASPDFLDGKVKNSIEVDSDDLQLVNDDPTPGNGYYYGTDSGGNKGWFPIASNTLLYESITLTNAQVLALNSSPIQIIANPGVGYAIDIMHASVTITGTAGTPTPYITNTNLILTTDTATIPQWKNTVILLSTVDRSDNQTSVIGLTLVTDTKLVENKSAYISVETGDPGGGNAGNELTINALYRVIAIP